MARGRKLNIPLIKGIVMFLLGIGVGTAAAITGIGAQVAVAPMLVFLLGFAAEKAGGTALVFSLFASAAGAFGARYAGVTLHIPDALLLALGAVVGAILVTKPAVDPRLNRARRVAHGLVMVMGVYVLSTVIRPRFGGIAAPHEFLQTAGGIFLIGLVCGAVSHLFQISSGVLLVPALVLLTGRSPGEAIATSLVVVAAASILPTITYASRGLIDSRFGPWMALGGALGGLLGGILLGGLSASNSPLPFIAFALVAMYLSAWSLWKSI